MKRSASFPLVYAVFGAPRGRRNTLPDPDGKPVRLRLTRARWTDYDYDQGGAYWGYSPGTSIYCGHNLAGVRIYTPAKNAGEAAAIILKQCPEKSTCGGRFLPHPDSDYAPDKNLHAAQTMLCQDYAKHLSR